MGHLQQRLTLAATCAWLCLLAAVQRAGAGVAYYGTAAQAQQLLPGSASVVLVPQGSTANLASVSSAVPVVYVGGAPGNGLSAVLLRDGADGSNPGGGSGGGAGGGVGSGFVDTILSWFPHIPIINPAPPTSPVDGSKPQKVENPVSPPAAAAGGESAAGSAAPAPAQAPAAAPARLEDLDEGLPPAEQPQQPGLSPLPLPLSPLAPRPGQKFVLVGQPQFFGNYDVLRQLGLQNIGTRGLLAGGAALTPAALLPPRHLGGKPAPEKLQQRQPADAAPAVPEAAAPAAADSSDSGFQRYSQQGALLSQRLRDIAASSGDSTASDESGSSEEKPTESEDAEQVVGADPPGPSVAQVKPQALALAGPGGVAAAAPMGTALVGPGGLAVAAPAATAIAGPAGGTPPIGIVPASQAYKQYLEAQKVVENHRKQQQQQQQNRRPAFIAYNA
ncbi:skin secretory protein xP2-like [Schistocerca americana]|uniref:skin secretory protein xP2-like n=1 Tax=Schistocerca americana TaxID=7009 RepID=UPI001F4F3300|nr:skin secretory protein xP2-like [Schistocerca americana]